MILSLAYLVLYLIIIGVIGGLLVYLIDSAPFIVEPFKSVLRWAVIAIFIVIAILILLSALGGVPTLKLAALSLLLPIG